MRIIANLQINIFSLKNSMPSFLVLTTPSYSVWCHCYVMGFNDQSSTIFIKFKSMLSIKSIASLCIEARTDGVSGCAKYSHRNLKLREFDIGNISNFFFKHSKMVLICALAFFNAFRPRFWETKFILSHSKWLIPFEPINLRHAVSSYFIFTSSLENASCIFLFEVLRRSVKSKPEIRIWNNWLTRRFQEMQDDTINSWGME